MVAAAQSLMNNKLLINLILLLLVTTLGLAVWLLPDDQQGKLELLTSVKPEAISEIEIEQPDGSVATFARRGGHWVMTRPYGVSANQVKLNSLSRVVEAPVLQSFPEPKQDRLAQFGLDNPIQLRVNDKPILFGGIEPISGHRYLLFNGRLMLLVDRFYHLLSSAAQQLVSDGLLPLGAGIELVETPDYLMKRTAQGWTLEPGQADVSGDDLSNRARAWRNAQALQIRPFDSVTDGDEVKLILAGGARITFVIVREGKRIWLVRPDLKLGYLLPAKATLLQPITPKTETSAKDA